MSNTDSDSSGIVRWKVEWVEGRWWDGKLGETILQLFKYLQANGIVTDYLVVRGIVERFPH